MRNDDLDQRSKKVFSLLALYLYKYPNAGPSQVMKDFPDLDFYHCENAMDLYTGAVEESLHMPEIVIKHADSVNLEGLQQAMVKTIGGE